MNDFTVFHMQYPVTECGQFLIMGNNQEGLTELATEIKKELMQVFGIG